ncbi:MAG: endolytic transglycosylase MltG [Pseudomonadota bacterium]
MTYRHWVKKTIYMIFALILVYLCISFTTFLIKPLFTTKASINYDFQSGSTLRNFVYYLQQQQLINKQKAWYFEFLARISGKSQQLQAGEYEFTDQMTPMEILMKMVRGEVKHYDITLVEGWTFKQIKAALALAPKLTHELNVTNSSTLKKILAVNRENFEGIFYPDTYQYTKGTTDIEILQRAQKLMQTKLNSLWATRAVNLPYKTTYQALIIASMIEKEARLNTEKPLIAGVIVNRLRKHMYLQIDPTVIYALGDSYHGKITSKDLRIRSPYNTYVKKGLPPTPISIPGFESLQAALNPAQTKALYFVAKGDGSHVFSQTLAQHDAAIKKYRLNKKTKKNSTGQ